MEPRFKTSFIPKQNLAASEPPAAVHVRSSGPSVGGIGTLISLIVFLGTLGFAGGIFLYESYLEASTKSKQEQLSRAREAFQPELIREMARLDQRLTSAENLLAEHVAPSMFFRFLEESTLQTVRFTQMTFAIPDPLNAEFTLTGEAENFAAVALQSDVFGSSPNIRDAVVSGFGVVGNGKVSFTVTGKIDPRLLSYAQTVTIESGGQPTP